MVKRDGVWSEVSWEEALEAAVKGLREIVAEKGADAVGALASASCTLEELFLFQKLVRGIGSANIDHRVRQRDFSDQDAAPTYPTIGMGVDELEQLDAALLVGSCTRKEHPIVNHRLRKASLAGASIMHLDVMAHDLNLASAARVVVAPSKLADRLAAVTLAAARWAKIEPEGLTALAAGVEVDEDAETIARTLVDAGRGAILLGPQAINHRDAAVLRGLAACLADLTGDPARYVGRGREPRRGVDRRSVLPHREANDASAKQAGLDARAMIEAGLDAYVLMGLEPELDCADGVRARRGTERGRVRGQPEHVPIRGDGGVRGCHALPIAAFAETEGTFVNLSGTWQSFDAAAPSYADSRPAWRVLRVLGNLFELSGFEHESIEDVRAELKLLEPKMAGKNLWRMPSGRRLVVNSGPRSASLGDAQWTLPPRLPLPDDLAGGLERIRSVPIYAADPLVRRSKPLQATKDAEFAGVGVNPATLERLGVQVGESVVVHQGDGSVVLDIAADPRVSDNCAWLPDGIDATAELGANDGAVVIDKN